MKGLFLSSYVCIYIFCLVVLVETNKNLFKYANMGENEVKILN